MRTLDTTDFTQDIHFPITRAVYTEAPKRTWYQKILKFATYRRWFDVREDYVLWVPSLNTHIFVPRNFLYDLASVPKVLNGLFNSNGMLLLGALPHDFGYRYECLLLVDPLTDEIYQKPFDKAELDKIFESLCALESKFLKASKVARITLGIAGFIGWKENRKKACVLRDDFPELFCSEEVYNGERQTHV